MNSSEMPCRVVSVFGLISSIHFPSAFFIWHLLCQKPARKQGLRSVQALSRLTPRPALRSLPCDETIPVPAQNTDKRLESDTASPLASHTNRRLRPDPVPCATRRRRPSPAQSASFPSAPPS